jgi:HlyD family secretion protein
MKKSATKMPSGSTQRLLLLAGGGIAAAALLALVSGCNHNSAAAPVDAEAKSSTVPVLTPTRMTLTRLVNQPGWIESYEQTPIYSKISGFVEEMNPDIDIGAHVKKDELLARLYVPERVEELEFKKSKVTQAKADLVYAQKALEAAVANVKTAAAEVLEYQAHVKRWQEEVNRYERLLKTGVGDRETLAEQRHQLDVSKAGVDRTQAAYIESEARREKARADVDAKAAIVKVSEADFREYKAWLDYREIRAPYDGVITERNIHTGHFVQPTSEGSNNKAARPLFSMVRMDIMRIKIQVPEYDAILIKDGKNGSPATVRIQGLLDHEFRAKVTRFSWALDEHARTLLVEIHVPNPKEELRPGMYAYASIEAEVPNALVVPVEAMIDDGEKSFVCFVVGDKVVRTPVKVGYRTDKYVQLLKKQRSRSNSARVDGWVDLSGKELIVARHPDALLDGQAVTVEVEQSAQAQQAQPAGGAVTAAANH